MSQFIKLSGNISSRYDICCIDSVNDPVKNLVKPVAKKIPQFYGC
jgi:hypothetical protein